MQNYINSEIEKLASERLDSNEFNQRIIDIVENSRYSCLMPWYISQVNSFLNDIYSEYVPDTHIAFLSGPSFASEVIQKLPTALVINAKNLNTAHEIAQLFPKFIRTYISDDVIGAEVAGAYKNVIAIAAGIVEGPLTNCLSFSTPSILSCPSFQQALCSHSKFLKTIH